MLKAGKRTLKIPRTVKKNELLNRESILAGQLQVLIELMQVGTITKSMIKEMASEKAKELVDLKKGLEQK